MSIDSLKKAYNGGDVPFPVNCNGGFDSLMSIIEKYLEFSPLSPDTDIQPLKDYIYYRDFSNEDREQVLLRYEGRFVKLLLAMYNDALPVASLKNPYGLLINAFLSALFIEMNTDEEQKERFANNTSNFLHGLIAMVIVGSDCGASDDYFFGQLFAAVVDAMPPSALYADYVIEALN
ncbi:hypothetical protein AGMMS49983_10020 [Clostridia bacterium]|nr:hypothetical protein AGMMS49983_10020 [Clostridia bacterium]